MKKNVIPSIICFTSAFLLAGFNLSAQPVDSAKSSSSTSRIYKQLQTVSSNSQWKRIAATPLLFTTYHTQGITRVNELFYMTAVKVRRWPSRYNRLINGYDRDNGEGTGYLFKFDNEGKLIDSIQLGEGVIYHPGGIDYDGKYIWVPVCEYRPQGKSIIYKVDPHTMCKTKMAVCNDAIGAVAFNRDRQTLLGMNWGSRKFYYWSFNTTGSSTTLTPASKNGITNPHFFIDYQDCQYIGDGLMLCSGLKTYKNNNGSSAIKLGGIQVIDMFNYASRFSLPVNVWSDRGAVITNNPFYAEWVDEKLRFYFVPDDDHSVLYTYELE